MNLYESEVGERIVDIKWRSRSCVMQYLNPNAAKGPSSVWNDDKTHIRERDFWKKLKNFESNFFSF